MARGRNKKKTAKKREPVVKDLDRFAGSSEEEEENDEAEPMDKEAEQPPQKQESSAAEPLISDNDSSINEEEEYTMVTSNTKTSLGMAGAMARILGNDASSSSIKSPVVVLSKTTTKLQRMHQEEKLLQKQQREKRKANRERNLTALHIPLSVATTLVQDEGSSSSNAVARELQEERQHRRVATRGVVALFNAIAQHQNVNQEEPSGSVVAPKLTKHGFLDMIKTKAAERAHEEETNKKNVKREPAAASKPKWNALQDDFMLNSKLKDWDKESSSEESSNDNVQDDNVDWSDQETEPVAKKQRMAST